LLDADAGSHRFLARVIRLLRVQRGYGGSEGMAVRFSLFAVAAVIAAAWPVSALAATAPADPPALTSAPYVAPAAFSWTPAANGPDILDPNIAQQVYRADGACPPGAVSAGRPIGALRDMTVGSHITSATLPDGSYCFHIRTVSALGGAADGPGLTVLIDTGKPTGTLTVAPLAPGNVVTGVVTISGTSADAVSGVASSTFHVGGVNACAAGALIGSAWDTTTVPNGTLQVCNVIVDKAGHVTSISTTVTIANPVATPVAAATAQVVEGGDLVVIPPLTPPIVPSPAVDPTAPGAPTKVALTLPRSRAGTGKVTVGLHWVKPTAVDLARVVVVLNLTRPPRSPVDGTRVYRGLATSIALKLKAGGTGYVALFAYDRNGNVSSPARKSILLAPLIPLRPTTGSLVKAAPRLTWRPQPATTYYNVQLFHNGTRVLMDWPAKPSLSIPAGKLRAGTYVWFVWPALKLGHAAPTFGTLIGRATFVYLHP
jgi:hypothetical protein